MKDQFITTDAVDARVDALVPAYIDVEPGTFERQSAAAVLYHVTIHGYLTDHLPDVDNIRIVFHGQLVHAEAWTFATGSRVIDFEAPTTELLNVVNNLRSRTTVQVQVQFRDSSTLVESSAIREIPVVEPRIVRLANEAAYTALATKVAGVIYWWP